MSEAKIRGSANQKLKSIFLVPTITIVILAVAVLVIVSSRITTTGFISTIEENLATLTKTAANDIEGGVRTKMRIVDMWSHDPIFQIAYGMEMEENSRAGRAISPSSSRFSS